MITLSLDEALAYVASQATAMREMVKAREVARSQDDDPDISAMSRLIRQGNKRQARKIALDLLDRKIADQADSDVFQAWLLLRQEIVP